MLLGGCVVLSGCFGLTAYSEVNEFGLDTAEVTWATRQDPDAQISNAQCVISRCRGRRKGRATLSES